MPPISLYMKHLFIINPRSFWNKAKQNNVVAGIHHFFKEIDSKDYEIHVSRFPRDAVGFIPLYARSLSNETVLRVYAVGGDGILFDCLNGIMGLANAELASIPYGHTNNFIRGFDNKALFRGIFRQYNATTVPLDVMRCGNNYALNYCVIGIEAETVRLAKKIRERLDADSALYQWLCRRLYSLFFFMGGLAAGGKKDMLYQQYAVTIDEESFAGVYQGFSIFNGSYYGGNMRPVSSAVPNDGILDTLSIRSSGILQTSFLYPFYISGRYAMFPQHFVFKRGRKISIRSENMLVISMDGEVFFETELEVEVLPAAVRFVDAGRYDAGRYDAGRYDAGRNEYRGNGND